MLLSIVIPVYNVEEYIEKCIISCVNQDVSLDQYEIIIVNDGSPDESLKICEKLEKEFTNIKIITQKNKGLSGARNTGLKNSIGEYVWFVDSDDWIAKNSLKSIYKAIYSYKSDVYWLGHDVVLNNKVIDVFTPNKLESPIVGEDFFVNHLANTFYIWKFIYKREFLLKNDLTFYEGILYEDLEFTPRALYLSKSCFTLPHIYYHYLMREGSIVNNVKLKNLEDRFFICNRIYNNIHSLNVSKEYYESCYKIVVNNIIGTIKMAVRSNLKLPKTVNKLVDIVEVKYFLTRKQKINLNLLRINANVYYSVNKIVYKLYKILLKNKSL